jgi:hypothetical protein
VTSIQPLTAARMVSAIWLLLAPLVWLGAAVSKMESNEHYNIQLGFATILVLVVIATTVGAFRGRKWARYILLGLSWAAASVWVYSGVSLSTPENFEVLIICIGIGFMLLAGLLHLNPNCDAESGADRSDKQCTNEQS